jgi:hypothetical protein
VAERPAGGRENRGGREERGKKELTCGAGLAARERGRAGCWASGKNLGQGKEKREGARGRERRTWASGGPRGERRGREARERERERGFGLGPLFSFLFFSSFLFLFYTQTTQTNPFEFK